MRISEDVLFVLENQLTYGHPSPNAVIINGTLDRKLYVRVNEVLAACGGAWNKKTKAHLFESDPRPLLDSVLATGEATTDKDMAFFATPLELARKLVELADVQPGDCVLEPSAGEGAIIDVLLNCGAHAHWIELDPKRHEKCCLKCEAFDLATTNAGYSIGLPQDFMTYEPDEPFDRVVMNPPFARIGQGDHLDHVRHAFEMLRPGGVLVSVLPSGVVFREDKRHTKFREWVQAHGTIDPLPAFSFKPSGTNVNTCVIRMVRP